MDHVDFFLQAIDLKCTRKVHVHIKSYVSIKSVEKNISNHKLNAGHYKIKVIGKNTQPNSSVRQSERQSGSVYLSPLVQEYVINLCVHT